MIPNQNARLQLWAWNAFIIFLIVAVLVADLFSPLGQAVWLVYIAIVAISLFSPSKYTSVIAATVSTVFLTFEAFTIHLGASQQMVNYAIMNRIIGGATLWVVAYAVYRFKAFQIVIQEDNRQRVLEGNLARSLATELELRDLADGVMDFFLKETHALAAAFYVCESQEKAKLVGSSGTVSAPEEIKINEGLVGRQILEKTPVYISDLPGNYLKISSSTGEAIASHILIIPMRFANRTRGVLEVASHQSIPADIVRFSERAADMLGQALSSSLYARDLRKALSEKSQQAEELQAQQEELRVTNEELEAQSAALRDSQAQLETQTSELEQSQVMMEEKNEELRGRNIELQRIKSELEGSARELVEANRYKSQFLSNMSHELRTPINSMLILSQLLGENKQGRLNAEEVEFAKTITTSGNDLLNLINEILDLSKVEAGMMELHIEEIRPQDVLERMRRFFDPLAEERGIELRIESEASDGSHFRTDQKRLEQILKNLLSNAIKFTNAGNVTLRARALGEKIEFDVEDTGIGVPKSKHQSIFRAFEQGDGTTARKYGGTGLGLSIVKELTRILEGQMHFESEPGKGSLFRLTLPAELVQKAEKHVFQDVDRVVQIPKHSFESLSSIDALNPKPTTARSASLGSGTLVKLPFTDDRDNIRNKDRVVAIIEDDPSFAKTLLKIARESDFKGVCSATGAEGIELIEKFHPSAVLLDMRLADTNGLTVLEHIKADPSLRHIPVQVVSAVSYEHNAMAMGAVGYLQKPTSIDEIRGAFKRVEDIISKEVKHVLIVEDDPVQRDALQRLVASPEVKTTAVGAAKEALEVLKGTSLDCMIIDLRLPDASGLDLLKQVAELGNIERPPVIVYTGKDLTRDEEMQLKKYSESIIIKGARSPERLLAETTLFLHRVERDLPQDKQKMLREVRERSDALSGRTVLLVDDDVRNVFALSAALEAQGLKVIAARNGREAIDKLHDKEKIELVLMDIMMPEMDGFEAMRRIRGEDRYRNLPIIALTAKAMKGDDIRCLEAGANDYLSKPVDLDKLLSLMRVWLSSVSGF